MVCREIIEKLCQQSPEEYACGWDNTGLLAGSYQKEVRRIYVALDATDETVEEAVNLGADMLLTHHPLIFKGLKKVSSEDFIGRRIIELIKNDIAYYAMHTNFDIAVMADLASQKLGLEEEEVLQVTATGDFGVVGIGKAGALSEALSLKGCIDLVKQVFEVDTVKVFAPVSFAEDWESFPVSKAAVCPGSGKSVIEDAKKAGAQVLITGDIDHHEGIDAAAQGMAVIDAGHYGLEKMFIPYMKEYLESRLTGVEVIAQKVKQPFLYV
ncbi:MAG: Nif3-like dinuclear metal center hexameric protein [Lachnospiraceae bacterium]|nr:Nif3-like dinuclear metal center hexameric protein [Lachnospiraceae bacterium]